MPFPTSEEIRTVAKIGEEAFQKVAPEATANLTCELTSIFGKDSALAKTAASIYEKLPKCAQDVINDAVDSNTIGETPIGVRLDGKALFKATTIMEIVRRELASAWRFFQGDMWVPTS